MWVVFSLYSAVVLACTIMYSVRNKYLYGTFYIYLLHGDLRDDNLQPRSSVRGPVPLQSGRGTLQGHLERAPQLRRLLPEAEVHGQG